MFSEQISMTFLNKFYSIDCILADSEVEMRIFMHRQMSILEFSWSLRSLGTPVYYLWSCKST